MDVTRKKVLMLWGVMLLAISLIAVTLSYWLTTHRADQLTHTLKQHNRQLAQPMPEQPPQAAPATEQQPVNVNSYLIRAARQYQVQLHYQHSTEDANQWLVTVTGSVSHALRFVAAVLHDRFDAVTDFPLTQTVTWSDTDTNSGTLNWQFRWFPSYEGFEPEPLATALFKQPPPPLNIDPLVCHSQPPVGKRPSFQTWSDVRLIGTQTLPDKKALLHTQGHPIVELREAQWLRKPLMQLSHIDTDFIVLQHWQETAGCWSATPVTLHLVKDNALS